MAFVGPDIVSQDPTAKTTGGFIGPDSSGEAVPAKESAFNNISKYLAAPERGMRGIGVGVEKLLSGVNPMTALGLPVAPSVSSSDVSQVAANAPEALQRAAAATEPGYVPLPGEKMGAYLGSTVGSLPIAYLLSGAGDATITSKIPYGIKTLYGVTRGAVSGGTLAAIHDASEKGTVDISDVKTMSALGGTVPLIRPTLGVISRVLNATADVLPKGTNIQPFATQALKENPKLLIQNEGTAESVGKKIENIQSILTDIHDKAGAELNAVKAKYGLPVTYEEQLAKYTGEGQLKSPTPDQALAQYTNTLTPDFAELPSEVKVKHLVETRQAIDDAIHFPKVRSDVPPISSAQEGFLYKTRDKINDAIMDAGGQDLRAAETNYSIKRALHDSLQQKLATAGKAEQTIMQVAKNGDIEEILGMNHDFINNMKSLEQQTGTKLLKPLQDELAAKNWNEMKATRHYLGAPAAGVGKEGMAVILPTLDRASKAVQYLANQSGNPLGKAALISTLTNPQNLPSQQ